MRPDRRGDLGKISVPTLVLVGEDDVITPPAVAKSLAEAIPGARLEVIAKAGHMAPYENPSVANAVILRFLAEPGGPSLMAEGIAGEIITTPAQLAKLVEHLAGERPVCPRYRVCLGRHVRADLVPCCSLRLASGWR